MFDKQPFSVRLCPVSSSLFLLLGHPERQDLFYSNDRLTLQQPFILPLLHKLSQTVDNSNHIQRWSWLKYESTAPENLYHYHLSSGDGASLFFDPHLACPLSSSRLVSRVSLNLLVFAAVPLHFLLLKFLVVALISVEFLWFCEKKNRNKSMNQIKNPPE